MQGQRGAEKPFTNTIDLNQGSNGPNQPTDRNSRPYPMDNHNLRNIDGWHTGESSSSTSPNPQSHVVGGGSACAPLNINLNAEHMATGGDGSDDFPYNVSNDEALSFKRKSLEGEAIDQHDFHAGQSSSKSTFSPPIRPPSFSQSEELNLQIGVRRGLASDVFPPITVPETGESSSRNHGFRVSHDNDRFNLSSTRNVLRLSDFTMPSSSTTNQLQSTHTHELTRNAPSYLFHGDENSRDGSSSTAAYISAERGISSRDESSSGSLTRNSMERSPFPHGRRDSAGNSSSPWATFQRHGPSRNPQRSSQFYPWAPFPSTDSLSSNFPPLRSGPSSSEEVVMPSGANQGHNRHHHTTFPRPSTMIELQGDDISEWHALAADIEGRQRLVSEIRNVLNSMRRGDNLRDEDYMLFDPFINGIAEFHDRHREMRLDVDNMSYEELLALEERIGDVNTGLSEEAILRSMKQRKHLCLLDSSSSNLEPCSICREEYVLGDNVGELDCGHDFHTDCVKQWLTQKNLCPICKTTALGT